MVKSLTNKETNNFYFLGEVTKFTTEEEVYANAYNLGFDPKHISIFTRQGQGNKLNFQVISNMLNELMYEGKVSEDWNAPILNNYLAITDKRGR